MFESSNIRKTIGKQAEISHIFAKFVKIFDIVMKKSALFLAVLLTAAVSAYAAVPRPEFPRPQFERTSWINLNGEWTYTFDFGQTGQTRGLMSSQGFDGIINVPFCPESKLSGVEYKDFINCMWYQRKVEVPADWEGRNVLIHFGAVDYYCALYVDGKFAGRHWGGTSSFEFDITAFTTPGKTANLVLMVKDDLRSGTQTGGKQSRNYYSEGCMYTRTTGIWQTVWMEAVNPAGLKGVYVKPDLDRSSFVFEPAFYSLKEGLQFSVKVIDNGKVVASSTAAASTPMTVTVPVKKAKTWSPESPFLYDIRYEVLDKDGKVIDEVKSYAGMRKVHIEGNRLFLNNEPVFLRFVLDQGFYPDGVWTAPTDSELKADIERSMAVGFNGARLHQKVFEERFHYWADKLGYLTWGESSSWGVEMQDNTAARNFLTEWEEIVVRDRNHPSIIAWTPFNEIWPCDYPFGSDESMNQYRFVSDVYNLTHNLDYRPVHDASGGLHVKTDIWSYHNYNQDPEELAEELTPESDSKVPTCNEEYEVPYAGQPYFLDEYGGIRWIIEKYAENSWGYGNAPKSLDEFYERLGKLTDVILGFDYISGFCYTQLTDVEQEQNGIYTYDRKLKFDAAKLKAVFGKERK